MQAASAIIGGSIANAIGSKPHLKEVFTRESQETKVREYRITERTNKGQLADAIEQLSGTRPPIEQLPTGSTLTRIGKNNFLVEVEPSFTETLRSGDMTPLALYEQLQTQPVSVSGDMAYIQDTMRRLRELLGDRFIGVEEWAQLEVNINDLSQLNFPTGQVTQDQLKAYLCEKMPTLRGNDDQANGVTGAIWQHLREVDLLNEDGYIQGVNAVRVTVEDLDEDHGPEDIPEPLAPTLPEDLREYERVVQDFLISHRSLVVTVENMERDGLVPILCLDPGLSLIELNRQMKAVEADNPNVRRANFTTFIVPDSMGRQDPQTREYISYAGVSGEDVDMRYLTDEHRERWKQQIPHADQQAPQMKWVLRAGSSEWDRQYRSSDGSCFDSARGELHVYNLNSGQKFEEMDTRRTIVSYVMGNIFTNESWDQLSNPTGRGLVCTSGTEMCVGLEYAGYTRDEAEGCRERTIFPFVWPGTDGYEGIGPASAQIF